MGGEVSRVDQEKCVWSGQAVLIIYSGIMEELLEGL